MSEVLNDRKIPIFVSGLPGNMASLVAKAVTEQDDLALLPVAMSSSRNKFTYLTVGDQTVQLLDYCPNSLASGRIAVDYTVPTSVVLNAIHYTCLRIPFVMGTSGGDRRELEEVVRMSRTCAVIATNMDPQIVGRQIDIDQFAQSNPGIFKDTIVEITESHQKTKRDVSGTAIGFRAQFERHGVLPNGKINSIRDTQTQEAMGIVDPDSGHAYHWVEVKNPNGEIIYQFNTTVRGRLSYVEGTLMAIRFLDRQMTAGLQGQVFSMRDVLKGGE